VTGPLDTIEELGDVVGDAVVFEVVTVPVGVHDCIRGAGVVHDRVADAAEVDGAHGTDPTVGGLMRVSGAHDLGLGDGEGSVELLVWSVRSDPGSIVESR
jgi:hypothetical protein